VQRIKLRNRQNDRNAAKTRAKQSDKDREERRIKIKNMHKRKRVFRHCSKCTFCP
jgi:hypothetical protein